MLTLYVSKWRLWTSWYKHINWEFLYSLLTGLSEQWYYHPEGVAQRHARKFHTLLSNHVQQLHNAIPWHEGQCIWRNAVIQFMYTQAVELNIDNVQDIMEAAHMVQMDALFDICKELFMTNLNVSKCLMFCFNTVYICFNFVKCCI